MDETLLPLHKLSVGVVGSDPDAISRICTCLGQAGLGREQISSHPTLATVDFQCDVLIVPFSAPPDDRLVAELRSARAEGCAVIVVADDQSQVRQWRNAGRIDDNLSWTEATPEILGRSLRHAAERRCLQQRLNRENQRLLTVIESNADGILVVGQKGDVLFANEAASRLLSRPADELIGSQFGYPVVSQDHADIELQNGRREGRTAELRAVDITWEGRPAKLLSLRDVSDRKRAEARARDYRRRVQRLNSELTRSEERERRRLARVLHDDIQQSLVAAKMAVTTVAGQIEGEDAQRLKNAIHFIEAAVATSRTLTSELTPTILDDLGLVPALHWLSRLKRERYGLTVTIHADLGLEVFDEDLRGFLFQSIRELLFNVTKHAGCVPVTVSLERRGTDSLNVVVEDEGTGFDPARMEAEERTSGGFGLFQIQQRIEDFGGTMTIESRPGSGSRFVLTVPNQSEPGEVPDDISSTPSETCVRVVLIDDSDALTALMSQLLSMNSEVEVVGTASNGAEGLRLAREMTPDVALVDVSLPDMPGTEVVRRMHADLPEMRIVGFSMHDSSDVAQAMRASGAVAYLKKDQPLEEILDVLRSRVA